MPPFTVPCRDNDRACLRQSAVNVGLILAALLASFGFLSSPSLAAQGLNINDLLRIIVPPPPAQSPPYTPPPRPPTPVYKPAPISQLPHNQIVQTQQMLNDLGYDAGPADGVAGRKTLEALNAFRRDNGLEPVGSVNRDAMAVLATIHRHAAASRPQPYYGGSPAGPAQPSYGGTPASSYPDTLPPTGPTSPAQPAVAQHGHPAALPGPHSSPSYDCSRASSAAEIAICQDPGLGALDVQLAALYAQRMSRQSPAHIPILKEFQRYWLKQRDQCADDRTCLSNAYTKRIAAVRAMADTLDVRSTRVPPDTQVHANVPMGTADSPHAGAFSTAAPPSHPPDQSRQISTVPGTATGTDLRALASPPPGLRSFAFTYFEGLPLIKDTDMAPVFSLMSYAHRLNDTNADCATALYLLAPAAVDEFMDPHRYQRMRCWRGADEFEQADTKRRFFERYHPTIKAFAPQPPFRVAIRRFANLGQYEPDAGRFRVSEMSEKVVTEPIRNASGLAVSLGNRWPEPIVRMDSGAARVLLEKLRRLADARVQDDPTAKLTVSQYYRTVELLAVVDIFSVDYSTQQVALGLVSLSLYDPQLSEKLYEFPVGAEFDTLLRGTFPDSFRLPAPIPMDKLYFSVQSAAHLSGTGTGTGTGANSELRWAKLYSQILENDRKFYQSNKTEVLAADDIRLPVFPRNPSRFNSAHMAQLQRWMAAYRAGLPSDVQRTMPLLESTIRQRVSTHTVPLIDSTLWDKRDYEDILKAEDVLPDQTVLWESDGEHFLIILPNRVGLYTAGAPVSRLKGPGLRRNAVFRTGATKAAVDKKGRAVLVMRLEPVSMAIENDAGVISQHTFENVPRLDGSFVAGPALQQPQDTAATDAERPGATHKPLELTASVLDLITVKMLGNQLPDTALADIVARRWRLENLNVPLQEGRFYIRGVRKPEPQELAEIAPKFREWAMSVLPDSPITLQARTQARSLAPGGIGLWERLECSGLETNANGVPLRIPRTPEAVKAATENANHNAKKRSRAWVELDRLRTIKSRHNEKVQDEQSWTWEQENRLVNLTAIYRLGDRYQRVSDSCQLVSEDLGHGNSPEVYLEFQDGFAIPETTSGNTMLNAKVTLEITAARMESDEPHYSDWLPPALVEKEGLAAPHRRSTPSVILDTRFKEAVYVNASGTEIARLTPDPDHSVQSVRNALVAIDAMRPKAKELDLLGIKLGMSMQDAEALVREHMDVGRVFVGKRAQEDHAASGRIVPVSSGKVFVSNDGRELIGLIDEPPAVEGKVLIAWRRVLIPANSVTTNDITADLRERYGTPTRESSRAMGNMHATWREDGAHSCETAYGFAGGPKLETNWLENTDAAKPRPTGEKPAGIVPDHDAELPGVFRDPNDRDRRRILDCGLVMSVQTHLREAEKYGRPPTFDWIEQNLTDIEAYLEAFLANRDAALANQSTAGAATGAGASGVKF